MSVTQEQVVDYIMELKLGEVKDLIETLEGALGVSASAPVVMGAGGAAGGAEEAAEEQTEFDVVLTSYGAKKIGVIKVVRTLTGLGLKEAKGMVDDIPSKIKEAVSKEEAEDVRSKLEEAGASVEIK